MGRPSVHKMTIKQEEFNWMQKAVPRHIKALQAKRKATPHEVSKKLLAAAEALADKLIMPPTELAPNGEYLFHTTRQDLRLLQEIIGIEHEAVILKVIPGYGERLSQDRARYEPYFKAATLHAEFLNALLNKIRERLG